MDTGTVGLLVNPIAGMGGRVGLKGTDTPEIVEEAKARGADPVAPRRARETLDRLGAFPDGVTLLTGPGPMGETVAREAGFTPTVVGSIDADGTTPEDTKRIAQAMVDRGIDVLVFAGGDGTARDVYDAIGDAVPVVGIPGGVKIYSGVFCATPRAAADLLEAVLAGEIEETRLREVMDIDEDAFRDNRLSAELHGYLAVPVQDRLVQDPKARGGSNETAAKRSIARELVDLMEPDRLYVIGPGTTTQAVMEELGLEGTLLGVDAVRNGELVGADLGEQELLEVIGDGPASIVVGIVGGQGFVFGRGNQQISPRVIRRVGPDNVIVAATEDKLVALRGDPLLVDTGDETLDETLAGYIEVVTGVNERSVVALEA